MSKERFKIFAVLTKSYNYDQYEYHVIDGRRIFRALRCMKEVNEVEEF